MKKTNWKKYALEFLSIFIAVVSAFALNNWNENRRDNTAEQKILEEINNGLRQDVEDLKVNEIGHQEGIEACRFWRDVIRDKPFKQDSLLWKYITLTRDFISLQNTSGYETLKSRGFELIENDSIRSSLISLYEYDYKTLRAFEEEYEEMQYQKSYFKEINEIIAPSFIYDDRGGIEKIKTPMNLSKRDESIMMSYLFKIELNRRMVVGLYKTTEEKVKNLEARIQEELK